MTLNESTSLSDLNSIVPEWEALYERCPDATPFHSPDWQQPTHRIEKISTALARLALSAIRDFRTAARKSGNIASRRLQVNDALRKPACRELPIRTVHFPKEEIRWQKQKR